MHFFQGFVSTLFRYLPARIRAVSGFIAEEEILSEMPRKIPTIF